MSEDDQVSIAAEQLKTIAAAEALTLERAAVLEAEKTNSRLTEEAAQRLKALAETEAHRLMLIAQQEATRLRQISTSSSTSVEILEADAQAADRIKAIAAAAAGRLLDVASSTAETLKESSANIARVQLQVLLDNAMFQAIFDSINDGIIVTDKSGKVLFFNRSALNIIGLSSLSDVKPVSFSRYYNFYKPDQMSEWPAGQDPLSRAIQGRTTVGELIYVRAPSLDRGSFISCMAVPLSYKAKQPAHEQPSVEPTVVGGLMMFRKLHQLYDSF